MKAIEFLQMLDAMDLNVFPRQLNKKQLADANIDIDSETLVKVNEIIKRNGTTMHYKNPDTEKRTFLRRALTQRDPETGNSTYGWANGNELREQKPALAA